MAKKLTDDQIKWILSLDASDAQKNIHELAQTNKSLVESNKAIQKSMLELEAQGKKNEAEWLNLKKSYDENNKSITNNKKQIDEMVKSIGYENMTKQQLIKTEKDLQKQLDSTSKKLSPEAYKALEKEIEAVQKAKAGLKSKTDDLGVSLNQGTKNVQQFFTQLKNGDVLGMASDLGKYAAIIGIVISAFSFLKSAMESNRTTMGALKQMTEGLTTAYDYLLKSIGAGDFTFKGMIEAFNAGVEYKKTLGEVSRMQQALSVEEAKTFNRTQELLEIQRDVTKSAKDRLAAGKEIVDITEKEGKTKQDVADKAYSAEMKRITALTGLSQVEYETFMEKYNEKDFKALNKSAKAYLKYKTDLESIINSSGGYRGQFGGTDYGAGAKAMDDLEKLEKTTDKSTKEIASFYKRYNKTTNDEIQNLTDKYVASIRVQGENDQSLLRVRRTNAKLAEDLIKAQQEKEKKAAEEAKKRAEERKRILEAEHQERLTVITDLSRQLKAEQQDYDLRLKNAGIFGKDLVDLTKEQMAEKLKIEQEHLDRVKQITIDAENARYAQEKKKAGLNVKDGADPAASGLSGEKLKAYEILYKEHQATLNDIDVQAGKTRQETQKAINDAILKQLQVANKAAVDVITSETEAEKIYAQSLRLSGKLDQEAYTKELERIDEDSLAKRLVAQEAYVKSLKEITNPTKEQAAELKAAEAQVQQIQSQINAKNIQDLEKFEQKKKQIRKQYGLETISEVYNLEKAELEKQHQEGLLSEKEYEQAKLQLKLKAAQQYAQQVGNIASAGSDFVQSLQTAETAAVTADYTKRISALNQSDADYADKKQKLEYEQKVKELDVQKKYADAQFAMQVAQISVAAATGIMNAWASSMVLGPIAGPIAAGVMTALIGGTAIAQIAAANSERQKIKAMTIESTSGSGSSNSTATVVDNTDSNSKGYADGGFTGNGGRMEVAGNVHRGEYVVSQIEMSDPALVPLVRRIDRTRQQRTGAASLPAGYGEGYADGGYTGNASSSGNMMAAAERMMQAADKLANAKFSTDFNYWEFKTTASKAEESRSKSKRG